ncbi:YadA family autotransporter adhesin [Burkholderia ubonensis]|nr:YadA-like family protein [Burkholderia ubonensis]
MGVGALASAEGSLATGVAAAATGNASVATGLQAQAGGARSVAVGAGAVASGDGSVTLGSGASATGAQSAALGSGAIATGTNSVALGTGSVADRDNTVSIGTPGNERKVTNLSDGVLPFDAVNLRQLNAVARRAYSGVAAATALTMIPDVDPGKTIAVGMGFGSYLGYQAGAFGASVRLGENLKMKVGAGFSSAATTWGAGASYSW